MKIGSLFFLSVLLWDVLFWGAYDQGIIISIIWCIKIWFGVSVVKDESLAFGHKSQKMGVLQVIGENPHDTSSDLGYLSTNHAESWLKNQRYRWRVWRCDSWVFFSHLIPLNKTTMRSHKQAESMKGWSVCILKMHMLQMFWGFSLFNNDACYESCTWLR